MLRLLPFLLSFFAVLHAFPVRGVILEEGSDRPIANATVQYASGKPIGEADRLGRIEFEVDRSTAVLVVYRPGYDTAKVELQDYADLLDVVITLRANVRELGRTHVKEKAISQWTEDRPIGISQLEDAAGMRFDVVEHLSQMPGVSGQRDFSSDLSYDGSRPSEVQYHLGMQPIPNMRHLDVGLPGNLSVINPHALSGLGVFDHYGAGPLQQGCAASIQFQPTSGNADDFKLRTAMGTTVREVYLTGPWLFWDSFVLSFRWLSEDMLQNMGEKFFTEFRKRSDPCLDCKVQSNDAFDLSSFDVYSRISGSDSLGAKWGITTLLSADEYAVRQDTSGSLSSVESATLVQGSQSHSLVGIEYEGSTGNAWHLGWVLETRSDSLRDTAGFRSDAMVGSAEEFRNFIDASQKEHSRYTLGWETLQDAPIWGASVLWKVDYELQDGFRSWYSYGEQKFTFTDHTMAGLARWTWRNAQHRIALGTGAQAFYGSEAQFAPMVSVDYSQKLSIEGARVFSNLAWRSQYEQVSQSNVVKGQLGQGGSIKAGLGMDCKYLKGDVHAFARYIPSPTLPEPQAMWYYENLDTSNFAWVTGAAGQVEWRTSHHFVVSSNWSSVYGEYDLTDGRSLPWEANVRLEAGTHLRYYPRADSSLSIILSHRAAWHRPLYQYALNLDTPTQSGRRSIQNSSDYTDLFRTDVRVNLDLNTGYKPLESMRFYLEVDNLLASLDVNALRWLGAGNARQRSVVIQDANDIPEDGVTLVPFLAEGMGLFVQFGVEGNLGFGFE